tara:strand:- start:2144 stop:2689 length:546 start_codon:yes stop_codon:yes gene_type:complete
MRKSIAILVCTILPLIGFSQSIFDKYEDMDNVGSVVINKGLIKLIGSLNIDSGDPDAEDFMEIAKGINGIKVFMTEDQGISDDMGATVSKYLKTASLEELMRVKDKDANVKFYIKNGRDENHVSELLMFISGIKNAEIGHSGRKFEAVLVSLTGDIDLNKIGSLTKRMNLPDELNKAGNRD